MDTENSLFKKGKKIKEVFEFIISSWNTSCVDKTIEDLDLEKKINLINKNSFKRQWGKNFKGKIESIVLISQESKTKFCLKLGFSYCCGTNVSLDCYNWILTVRSSNLKTFYVYRGDLVNKPLIISDSDSSEVIYQKIMKFIMKDEV